MCYSCPEDENHKLSTLLPEMSGGRVDRPPPEPPHSGRGGRRLCTRAPQYRPHQEWKGEQPFYHPQFSNFSLGFIHLIF